MLLFLYTTLREYSVTKILHNDYSIYKAQENISFRFIFRLNKALTYFVLFAAKEKEVNWTTFNTLIS